MNEAPDPLEAELSALRPHEMSPGLRRGVAERLAAGQVGKSDLHRRLWRFVLAGGLAAACLAAFLLWWGSRRAEPEPPDVRPQPLPPAVVEDSGPTLLKYQRALARSPEELDALLDEDAVGTPVSNPELGRFGTFT